MVYNSREALELFDCQEGSLKCILRPNRTDYVTSQLESSLYWVIDHKELLPFLHIPVLIFLLPLINWLGQPCQVGVELLEHLTFFYFKMVLVQ